MASYSLLSPTADSRPPTALFHATISAAIATAISSGRRAPTSTPIGMRTRSRSASREALGLEAVARALRFRAAADAAHEREAAPQRPLDDALIERVVVGHDEAPPRRRQIAARRRRTRRRRTRTPGMRPSSPHASRSSTTVTAKPTRARSGAVAVATCPPPTTRHGTSAAIGSMHHVDAAAAAHAELGAELERPLREGDSASSPARERLRRAARARAITSRSTAPPPTVPTHVPSLARYSFCPGVAGRRAVARERPSPSRPDAPSRPLRAATSSTCATSAGPRHGRHGAFGRVERRARMWRAIDPSNDSRPPSESRADHADGGRPSTRARSS